MTSYKRGDVVLISYPLSDRPSPGKRPAVVVSNDNSNEILIAQVTGHLDSPSRQGDHHITDWQMAGLLRPSLVRTKLATVPTTIILRKLGTLHQADLRGVEMALKGILGLDDLPYC